MPEKQTNQERLKEITDSIEQGIQDLFQSDRYAQYLTTMSRFHRYSVNNTMLIYMQKPNATLVAGFNKWRDQFERNVKRGEKGIKIIAPTPFKKKIEAEKLDPDTNLPMLDADGKVIMEEKEIKIPMYKPVSVFDVSQTEGKPLPQLAADLAGNVQNYEVFMEALQRTSPVPIAIKPVADGSDGFFSLDDQSITIRKGMSEIQTVSATVHEIAHSKLHNTKDAPEGEESPTPKNRRTEEVEAESISYAVCQYYGIQTGENSFGYIAGWSKGKELKELRASLETINKTASELITDIDRHYAAICKERGIDPKEQAEQPAPEQESALYLVNDAVYIHIQPDGDGHCFDAYLKEGMQHFDDGIIDLPGLSSGEALLEAAAMMGLPPDQAERVPLAFLQDGAVYDQERLYLVGDSQYLHLQPCEDGYDYTLYDRDTMRELDGGQIDLPDTPVSTACLEVCKLQGIDHRSISTAPLDMVETLREAQPEPVPTPDAVQDTGEEVQIDPPVEETQPIQAPENGYLPDPTMSIEAMNAYGYTDSDMLPLSKDRALELMERDVPVYMLYDNNSAAMAFEPEDIQLYSGFFGVNREEWEQIRDDIPPMDATVIQQKKEQAFLNSPQDSFAIYQLRRGDDTADLRFMDMEHLEKRGVTPARENYELVYSGPLTATGEQGEVLEDLYRTFNVERPADFTGHSLSVSDIVALRQSGVVSCHYVDSIGYKELPGFLPQANYLKNAEMQIEDDYGMIDGIVNNGPKATVAELEQQARSGQPISLMDLADAVHREKKQKKPSVLAKLRKYQEESKQAENKTKEKERDL